MQNSDYLKALKQENTSRTPIWIMRQAGRYLPEYRKIRAQAGSFMGLCTNPELAAQVTLQPLERFDLDAAIIFSDILTIPDAMGLGLNFKEGEGPIFTHKIQNLEDINNLISFNPFEQLSYVMDAIKLTKKNLKPSIPLIGFSGSPWTLACYMIQGQSSKDFAAPKKMLYQNPNLLHQLLKILTQAVTDYLLAQIQSGVDSLMIFDTWGGLLTHHAYEHCSLIYMSQIIKNIKTQHPHMPITLFTKGGGLFLENLFNSGADCVGLDWTIEIKKAREINLNRTALQGNLDPCVLYGTEEEIHKEVSRILSQAGAHPGHIFNLGHGISPDIDPGKVKFLVDLVHSMSEHYHE